MYTKIQLIHAIQKEFNIIKHLGTKIEIAYLTHQFTEKQRTIKELMAYLAYGLLKQVQLIHTEDMGVFANMKELMEHFDHHQFNALIDTASKEIIHIIETMDDEHLAKEFDLFGTKGPKFELLVNNVLTQLAAYKMQLFLQLKHAGKGELNSMNLWAGIDKA